MLHNELLGLVFFQPSNLVLMNHALHLFENNERIFVKMLRTRRNLRVEFKIKSDKMAPFLKLDFA